MKKFVSQFQSFRSERNLANNPVIQPLQRYSTVRRIEGPLVEGDIAPTGTSSIGTRNPAVDETLSPGARRVRRFSKPRVIQGPLDGVDGVVITEDSDGNRTNSFAARARESDSSAEHSSWRSSSSSGISSRGSRSRRKHKKKKKGKRRSSGSSKRSSKASDSTLGDSSFASLNNQAASAVSSGSIDGSIDESSDGGGTYDMFDESDIESAQSADSDEEQASLLSDSDEDSDASSATPTTRSIATSEVSEMDSDDDAISEGEVQQLESEVGSEVESEVDSDDDRKTDDESESSVTPEFLRPEMTRRESSSSSRSHRSKRKSSTTSQISTRRSSNGSRKSLDSEPQKEEEPQDVSMDDTDQDETEEEEPVEEEPIPVVLTPKKQSKKKKSKKSKKKKAHKGRKSKSSRKKHSGKKPKQVRRSRSLSPVAVPSKRDVQVSESVHDETSDTGSVAETQSLPSNDAMPSERPGLTQSNHSSMSLGLLPYSHQKWQRNSLGKWSLSNESSQSLERPIIKSSMPKIVLQSYQEHQDKELWGKLSKPSSVQERKPSVGTSEPLHHREFLGTPFVSAATYKAAIRGKSSRTKSSKSRGRSSHRNRTNASRSRSVPASSKSRRARAHRRLPSSVKEESEKDLEAEDEVMPLTPSQVKKQQQELKLRMEQSQTGKTHVSRREQPLFDRSRAVYRSIDRKDRPVRQSSLTKYRDGTSRISREVPSPSRRRSGSERSGKSGLSKNSQRSGNGPAAPHLHVNTPNRWLRTASGRWDTGAQPPSSPVVVDKKPKKQVTLSPPTSPVKSSPPVDMTAVKFKGGFDSSSRMTAKVSNKLTKSIAAGKGHRRLTSAGSRLKLSRSGSTNSSGRSFGAASGGEESSVLRNMPNLWNRSNVMVYSSNPHCDAASDEGDVSIISSTKTSQYLKAAYSKLRGSSPPSATRKSMGTSVSSSSTASSESRLLKKKSFSERRKSLFRRKPGTGFYQGSIFTNGGRRNETGGGCADIIRQRGAPAPGHLYKQSPVAQKIIAAAQKQEKITTAVM